MKIPMEETVERACRDVMRGTRTLPDAMRDVWLAARREENLDHERMAMAERNAKALKRAAPKAKEGTNG